MSGVPGEASAGAEGRLSEGARPPPTPPRPPGGPSEARMRRSPIFSIGQVFQKSRPVSSCTFSSRERAAKASVSRLSVREVVSVIGVRSVSGRGSGGDGGEAAALGAALLLRDRVGHGRGQQQLLGVGVLR